MKWFNKTAQGFSPGLTWFIRGALKAAPDVWPGQWINAATPLKALLGRRFQSVSGSTPNPGLKPWAVLSDHFMVKEPIS